MSIVTAPPLDVQAVHRHADARLIVHLGGEMEEKSFEGEGTFKRCDFVFRPAFFAHANRAGTGGACYVRLPISPEAVRRWVRTNGWRAARGTVELHRSLSGEDALASALSQPYARRAAATKMEQAAALLASEAQPRVRDVAERFGLAPYAFTRRFAAAFGVSPAVYRRQARVQRALRMMAEDGRSLAAIAVAAGFHDQSHLHAELGRETGRTPRALMAMIC